jgi:GNAT superfamily N-acetyltransferase
MSITIRPATTGDLDVIAAINASVFLGDRDNAASARRWVDCWRNAYPLYQYFVACDGDTVVGYAGWQLHGGFLRAEPAVELDQLGVVPEAQGKGVGPQLIEEGIDLLMAFIQKTNNRIESRVTFVVWVYEHNANARKVYERFFTDGECGKRMQFGDRPEIAYRLRRPLILPVRT